MTRAYINELSDTVCVLDKDTRDARYGNLLRADGVEYILVSSSEMYRVGRKLSDSSNRLHPLHNKNRKEKLLEAYKTRKR